MVAAQGVDPAHAAMLGDDIESDVGGALAAGLAGVLVRTGKYTQHAVRDSGLEPTATIDSIADLPDLLEDQRRWSRKGGLRRSAAGRVRAEPAQGGRTIRTNGRMSSRRSTKLKST